MVDHKEFFAEMSVTYLSKGYSFLDKAENTIIEECSPPLLQPTVTDRVLKKHGIEEPLEEVNSPCWFLWNTQMPTKPKIRIVNPILQESAIRRSCLDMEPCNKFYPFTKGQLRYYDETLFKDIQELWKEIAMWDDPVDETSCKSLKSFLPSFRWLTCAKCWKINCSTTLLEFHRDCFVLLNYVASSSLAPST